MLLGHLEGTPPLDAAFTGGQVATSGGRLCRGLCQRVGALASLLQVLFLHVFSCFPAILSCRSCKAFPRRIAIQHQQLADSVQCFSAVEILTKSLSSQMRSTDPCMMLVTLETLRNQDSSESS